MDERDWSAFACPNPACSAYGQRGGINIRPHGWSSKPRNIRCLRCTLCGKNFSERAGTPLFRTQLPTEKILQIAQHVVVNNDVEQAMGEVAGIVDRARSSRRPL